jgi:hypothetical protein
MFGTSLTANLEVAQLTCKIFAHPYRHSVLRLTSAYVNSSAPLETFKKAALKKMYQLKKSYRFQRKSLFLYLVQEIHTMDSLEHPLVRLMDVFGDDDELVDMLKASYHGKVTIISPLNSDE